jgi:hypothetical protein
MRVFTCSAERKYSGDSCESPSNSDGRVRQLLSQKYNLGFKMWVNFHFQFPRYLKSKQFDFDPVNPKPLTAAIVITKLKTNYMHHIDYKETHLLT